MSRIGWSPWKIQNGPYPHPPTPARHDAPSAAEGRSTRRDGEVHTALRANHLPIELILVNGLTPQVLFLFTVETLRDANTKLEDFFNTPLDFMRTALMRNPDIDLWMFCLDRRPQ